MEKLQKRIQQLKKRRPKYQEILDFYLKVREAQEKAKTSLKIESLLFRKEWKDLLEKEGFSLIQKEDFPIDVGASAHLFQFLCEIAKGANPFMAGQVRKIEEAIAEKGIVLKELLAEGIREVTIEQIADESGLDKKVFLFLVYNSIRPSIEITVEQLSAEGSPESWPKGYCPICGSLPSLSLLKGEVGKRHLLCSYCGNQWRTERLFCPFCNNKENDSLHYFFSEQEEAYRIDLCDQCQQYIKTIDLRRIEEVDPFLEDLATPHLDLFASQKGYRRPVPNPWTT